jgi:hypothetical protein
MFMDGRALLAITGTCFGGFIVFSYFHLSAWWVWARTQPLLAFMNPFDPDFGVSAYLYLVHTIACISFFILCFIDLKHRRDMFMLHNKWNWSRY